MIKDDVGMFSLAAQAVGFSPSEVRLATEGRSAIYSHTKRLDNRRTELMTDYVRAIQRDEVHQMAKEIWAEIGIQPEEPITPDQQSPGDAKFTSA